MLNWSNTPWPRLSGIRAQSHEGPQQNARSDQRHRGDGDRVADTAIEAPDGDEDDGGQREARDAQECTVEDDETYPEQGLAGSIGFLVLLRVQQGLATCAHQDPDLLREPDPREKRNPVKRQPWPCPRAEPLRDRRVSAPEHEAGQDEAEREKQRRQEQRRDPSQQRHLVRCGRFGESGSVRQHRHGRLLRIRGVPRSGRGSRRSWPGRRHP